MKRALVSLNLLLIGATWTFAETGVKKKEILIGSCYVHDATVSKFGVEQIRGARSYIDYINKQGGVFGRQIKLLDFDDKNSPEGAIECFRKLLSENVFAAAFFAGSVPGLNHLSMAEANKVPIIGMFVGSPYVFKPFKRYVFSLHAPFGDQIAPPINNFWDAGLRKFAIIRNEDPFGLLVRKEMDEALAAHKAELVAEGLYPRQTENVNDAIDKVRAANPEVVLITGLYKGIAAVLKRAHAIGWHPIFFTNVVEPAIYTEAGKTDEGLIGVRLMPDVDSDAPSVKLFRELFSKLYPTEKMSGTSLEGFASAMILVEGLKRAGKQPTREGLIHAIESLNNFDLGLGPEWPVNFSPENHKGFHNVYFTIIRNDKVVPFDDWKGLANAHKNAK